MCSLVKFIILYFEIFLPQQLKSSLIGTCSKKAYFRNIPRTRSNEKCPIKMMSEDKWLRIKIDQNGDFGIIK